MAPEPYYFPTISKSQFNNRGVKPSNRPDRAENRVEKSTIVKSTKMETLYRKSDEPDEKEAAYSEGLLEGKRLGVAQEKTRVDATIQILNQAIDQINHQKTDLREKMEEMAATLAITIARKIIGKEIHFDNRIVLNTLKRSIDKFNSEDRITFIVHPEDKSTIQSSIVDINKKGQLTVIADSSIERGGCVAATDFKTFDARIESQLEIVENALEAMRMNPDGN